MIDMPTAGEFPRLPADATHKSKMRCLASKRREQLHTSQTVISSKHDDGEFYPGHRFAYARREEIRGLRSGGIQIVCA